jgi:Xaa-Pro dipeptidase
MHKVPQHELQERMKRFRELMIKLDPNWEIAYIFTKISQYYFTGTMQDGVLIIPRDNEATLWVRQSYERALDESNFAEIKQMYSYREAAATFDRIPESAYVEKEFLPLAIWDRFSKYFPTKALLPLGSVINALRAIKSPYEMEQMMAAGKVHQDVFENIVPTILKEGMSEAELGCELFAQIVKAGHQGMVRFGMFDTDLVLGHIAFGESAIYPTHFNGPGGNYGLSPAVPTFGSREHKLKRGDLVFLDVAVGVNGYHTDKSMTYVFGGELTQEVKDEHQKCIDIQNRIAEQLKPGIAPSAIYQNIMESLSPEFILNFMGYGDRQVKFLGHSIGLFIDEAPVIARGFDEPIVEDMCFAIEPKKGIKNVGLVGTENTFRVTKEGGVSITGEHNGLLKV